MPVIRRRSLADTCYQIIKDDILTRRFAWGERLDIDALAAKFGVSRSPVVQAIGRLAHDGLVVVQSQKGSYVVRPTRRDIEEVTQVRIALETHAVELAIPRLTEEDFEHLGSLLSDAENSDLAADSATFLQSDRKFHEAIVQATGNTRLIAMFDIIRSQVELFRVGAFTERTARNSMRAHRSILEALNQRDVAQARARVRRHIEEVGRDAVSTFVGKGGDAVQG